MLNGGILGGINQDGKNRIDCRFNKKELIRRITEISKKKSRIQLYNMDAVKLIKLIQRRPRRDGTIYYFDPPYYLKGASLYMNHYRPGDHRVLADEIKKINGARWLMTYDNVSQINDIYRSSPSIKYMLYYSVRNVHKGREIMIFSKNLRRIPLDKLMAVSA